jgi:predicted nucleotidyltransferase
MKLAFPNILALPNSAADRPTGDWSAWAVDHAPPALFLSAWSGSESYGFDSPLRLGGVLAQPADVVLGIRAWEDAFEGTLDLEEHGSPVPFVLFEVEKIVRMMLHQSGLAFEILASPAILFDQDFPAQRIIEAAITSDILHHYRDVASSTMRRLVESKGQGATPADTLDVARHALTGRALAQGRVAFDVWELADEFGVKALLRDVEAAERLDPTLLAEVSKQVDELLDGCQPDRAQLPANPQDYDWLNDLVVGCRRGRHSSDPSKPARK